jgi:hypothetical protein
VGGESVKPRIRFVDAKGDIHNVIETPVVGFHAGLAVDSEGNIYVPLDTWQIIKLDRNFRSMARADAITIVAGTGKPPYG